MILEPGPLALEPTLRRSIQAKARPTLVFGLPESQAVLLRDYLNFVLPPDEPKLREYVNRLFAQEES